MFGPAPHAYKYSPALYEVMLERIFTDIATRFHTPYTVCIHPTNWVLFSGDEGKMLVTQAREKGLPIWSLDQWALFWDARDTWRFEALEWDGAELCGKLAGGASHNDLRVAFPTEWAGARLADIWLDGEPVEWEIVRRYRQELALVRMPAGKLTCGVRTTYR
jgi:hypothetical protein